MIGELTSGRWGTLNRSLNKSNGVAPVAAAGARTGRARDGAAMVMPFAVNDDDVVVDDEDAAAANAAAPVALSAG